jgi:succinate dehydrogenase / fumarate reductase cytochrome b subunit
MAAQQRPLSPHLQVYRLPLAARLSILHRATGVFLLAGALMMVWWIGAVAAGEDEYARFLECATSLPGRGLLFLALSAYFFHLFTGLRHLFWDIGLGLELKRTLASNWVIVAFALLAAAMVGWMVFAGSGA